MHKVFTFHSFFIKSGVKFILLVVFFFFSTSSNAQKNDLKKKSKPNLFHFLLPGGTHFYKKEYTKGTFFALSEISLFASGLIFDKELKKYNKSE